MIEVFKTNVREDIHARELLLLLNQTFPCTKINFDLEDCDNILRMEGDAFIPHHVMSILNDNGFFCGILD